MPRRFSRRLLMAAPLSLLAVCAALPAPVRRGGPPTASNQAERGVTRPTLYVVGYSHLDDQWCWTYPQVIREFLANTLHENFALFKKYPDYVFNWTGSNRYRWMKEYYPAEYAELKKYVAQGRWFPAGSSVVEGDVNSPSSESLIRQVLYGNEFFRDEFGIASDEYMLPDCFGFPASLPSILAHCGIKGFSTQKLTWGSAYRGPGPRTGVPFNVGRWVGPDGRAVVSALNAMAYDSGIDDDLSRDATWIRRMERDDIGRDGVPADYRYYGVGDRGGAPDEASVQNLEKSLHGSGPLHVVGGRADQMFNDLSADQVAKLPTYQGDLELTQHSAGSLTSEAAMKRWNRKNEELADATERASVAAEWLGALPYDKTRITDAWLRFLPGQFHDLMAGTALPLAYNFTWNDEILAMNEFAGQLATSVGAFTRGLDTSGAGLPIVVYNPLSITRDDIVEATVDPGALPLMNSPGIEAVGPDGQVVPVQLQDKIPVSLIFRAHVPPVGFAVYRLRPARVGTPPMAPSHQIENSRYRVTVDMNGDVASIYDKSIRHELLAGPARLVLMQENPTNFPAWNMDWNDQRQPPRSVVTGPAKVDTEEVGPVRQSLRITREFEGSKFVQTIRLGSGDSANRVEFDTAVDWVGKEAALKAEFPLASANSMATYNWGIGTVQRGNNDPLKYEVPFHGWMDLTGPAGDFGAAILCDTKFGSDKPDDRTLRLTLLYTPGVRGGYQHQATQDWGHEEVLYAIEGHGSKGQVATQWQSLEMGQPLIAFTAPSHPGPLGRTFSLAKTSSEHIQIEAIKQAEKGRALVVRFNELAGAHADNVHVEFASPVLSAVEVDGQEREIGPAAIEHGELVFSTTAYRPRSFAVRLAPYQRPLAPAKSIPVALPYNLSGVSPSPGKSSADFDGTGRALPGEVLPKSIVSGGVEFHLGPTGPGQKNVLAARGQRIPIRSEGAQHLYLLAAVVGDEQGPAGPSDDQESIAIVRAKRTEVAELTVQGWDGFIGQWDNRLWAGNVPELTYSWNNPLAGLVPGFIKRNHVAWYADHLRKADGTNDIYHFCYLYRYEIPLTGHVTAIELPHDPRLRIVAAALAKDPAGGCQAAQPLYDVIDHRENGAPGIHLATTTGAPLAGRRFNETVVVTFTRPMYWKASEPLRYTLDGTPPTSNSRVAGSDPIYVSRSASVLVAQFDGDHAASAYGRVDLEVHDETAPRVESAITVPYDPAVRIRFSKPVDRAGAERVGDYILSPPVRVDRARLSADSRTATLSLAAPLPPNGAFTVAITGVRDLTPDAHPFAATNVPVEKLGPVYAYPGPHTFGQPGVTERDNANLPIHGSDPWTFSFFVNSDAPAADLTMIAGFGDGRDNHGAERYLVVHNGAVEFWGSDIDLGTGQPLVPGRWQMWSVTYDGEMIRIFRDGVQVGAQAVALEDAAPTVRLAPPPAWRYGHRFTGQIAKFTIWNQALPPAALRAMASAGP